MGLFYMVFCMFSCSKFSYKVEKIFIIFLNLITLYQLSSYNVFFCWFCLLREIVFMYQSCDSYHIYHTHISSCPQGRGTFDLHSYSRTNNQTRSIRWLKIKVKASLISMSGNPCTTMAQPWRESDGLTSRLDNLVSSYLSQVT